MASNVVNYTWNTLHSGNRCPVNDTDADGAPVALGSHDPLWEEGSINRAVKATWDLNGETVDAEDQDDYDAGKLTIRSLGKYIYSDMLYGYKGDSVDKSPGDMMSFRAYPTGVVTSEVLEKHIVNSNVNYNPDGSVEGTAGEYIVMRYKLTLAHKLPYDVEYEIEYNEGGTIPTLYNLLIEAGSLVPTKYKRTVDSVWIDLITDYIYFSTYSAGFTGDKTMTIESKNPVQLPFYGPLGITSTVVTQAEYDTVVPAPYYRETTAYKSPLIYVDCTLSTCAEYPEANIKNSGITSDIYFATGESPAVGIQAFSDLTGTPMTSGTYCNATYFDTIPVYGNIYRVTRIFIIDSLGYITSYHNGISTAQNCWQTIGCGRTT